jgi:hypothetical protein
MKKLMILLVVSLAVLFLALGFRLYDEQPNEQVLIAMTAELKTYRQMVYLPIKMKGLQEECLPLVSKDLPVRFGPDDCLCYTNDKTGVLPQCK